MNSSTSQSVFEKAIDYEFLNKELLEQALTSNTFFPNFEPLAQIGDSVIKVVLTAKAWELGHRTSRDINELKQLLERRSTLSSFMTAFLTQNEIDPEELFKLNRGELKTKQYWNNFGEFLEAVVGAVYLDCDFSYAKKVAEKLMYIGYFFDIDES